VPPFAVNRYASPLLECPIAIPFVSGKHPQVPLGESKATGEADVVFPSALTKGTPLGKRKGGPSGDRNGTGNAGHLKSGGGPAPSFSSTSPRRLPVLRSTKVTRFPPSSVRWLSALPTMNRSGSSTRPTAPKWPVSRWRSSAAAVLSCLLSI